MNFRPAISRPIRTLLVFAMLAFPVALAPAPAPAQIVPGVVVNNLTPFGSLGVVRVRPVAAMSNGAYAPLIGDGSAKQNPNRGIGDGPASCPHPACRLLGNNGPFQPGWDAHTHYHPGESRILINDTAGLVKGDTILIGNSLNCNYPFQQLRCNGVFDEQSSAEVNYVVSSVPTVAGPNVVDLAFPLTFGHLEGERVAKLPTLYQGQTLRVDVPDPALTNGGAATVAVRAFLVPPGRDPNDEDNYFQLGCTATTVACEHIVPTTSVATSSFFIRNIESAILNVGRTFSWNTADDWYSVLISARNPITNTIVSDGFYRFKVNPVALAMEDCDGNSTLDATICVSPDEGSPGAPVNIFGRLMDNSSIAATDRNAEAVIVDVALENPLGLTFTRTDSSCYDSNPAAADPCGNRVPTRIGTDHGVWFVRFGFEPSNPLGLIETLVTGTYDVTSTARISPAATDTAPWDVVLNLF